MSISQYTVKCIKLQKNRYESRKYTEDEGN